MGKQLIFLKNKFMKRIFSLMLFVCIHTIGFAQQNKQLKDGLYLVDKLLNDTTANTQGHNQALVHFNPDFLENAPTGSTSLLINTAEFVPLELKEEPSLLSQTNNKGKLQLTFSPQTSDKLERFTANHLMQQATLIVSGEALIVHKIRDTIRNGKMEITGCSDNACQRIYKALKDHIKK